MFKKFYAYEIKKARKYFQKNKKARIAVVSFMSVAMILIAVGVFYLAKQGLQSTQEETDAFMLKAVPLYIYQIFLLITGFFIFISSIIFGLFNFFKGEYDTWIMASPEYKKLSWINFVRATLNSSWPAVIFTIPLLLAIQNVFDFSLFAFLISFLAVLSFSFFCAALAIILIFLTSLIMKFFKQKSFVILALLSSLYPVIAGVLVWLRLISADLSEIFQVRETTEPALTLMKENFAVFPSHPAAMTIHNLQLGQMASALESLGIMVGLFLLVILMFTVLKENFLYIWQTFQEGAFEAQNRRLDNRRKLFLRNFPHSPEDVIAKKELLTGIRSSKNFFWFLFLVLLLLAQVGVVNLIARYAGSSSAQEEIFVALIPALQLGMILYFISAFILRFVFPSFSQEGSTSWIVGAAPVNLKSVFWTKYRFYASLITFITIFAISFYALPLLIPPILALTLFAVGIIAVLTLTMLGLSLGVIFVNFETNDPHMLSTSASGIIFTVISLGYSGLSAFLLYMFLAGSSLLPLFLFILLSVLIYILCYNFALKSLENIEFF